MQHSVFTNATLLLFCVSRVTEDSLSFSMLLICASSLQLHPLLRHLRKRSAGRAEAAVQGRSPEGRRVERQSPEAQSAHGM